MTGFFEQYFNIVNTDGETKVCCPFNHKSNIGTNYKETNPSASVNLDKRLFHCNVCGRGFTETQFISEIYNCTSIQANKLKIALEHSMDISEWNKQTLHENGQEICKRQGIDLQTAICTGVKSLEHDPDGIMIPVTYRNAVIDVRNYRPGQTPKVMSMKGAPTGFIIPINALASNKVVWICEGEHDMLVARSNNLNAVCITGGAGATPFYPDWFKDKTVAICYDNDDAGRLGAIKLGNILKDTAKTVKVLDMSKLVPDNKGDVADYFATGGTRNGMIELYKNTPDYEKVQLETTTSTRKYKERTIADACLVDNLGETIITNVQVNGVNDDIYVIPGYINCSKVAEGPGDMDEGMQADWELSEKTLRDIVNIVAVSADDNGLRDRYKELCGVMKTEKNIAVRTDAFRNVYIATVMDIDSDNPQEITVYSIDKKLESGHKYKITHKIVTSPNKAGLLISICTEADEAVSDVDSFKVDDSVKASLINFQQLGETAEQIMNSCIEKVKGLLGYNGNNQLIQTIDLAYHTPLRFNFGRFENIRAYIDTLIVGESRVGKSSTAQCLLDHYKLGQFVSLAGNSATVPALIGGSNKTSTGQMQTKAGVIPMNHKGLIIFEEFGKCANNITAELTDVRSSNEVRINRVAGSLTLPAFVRMITLSNVKPTATGDIRPINSYPNGIAIATELVPTAEDIARYDAVLISAYKGDNQIDPLWVPEEPMSDNDYRNRIKWIWSRTPEQIKFTADADKKIVEEANRLNKLYECHIKIFGTECWKKLSRIAIAIAGYTASTDETFENIVVTPEIVKLASEYLVKLYDNDTFRLKEYVNNERKYSEIDKAGIEMLGNMYFRADTLLKAMDEEAQPTKNSLTAAFGGTNDEFNAIMREFTRANMITISGTNIMPTTRFRKGMALCKRKEWRVERVYEELE